MLDIISITKDDLEGIRRTLQSTRSLRRTLAVHQIVIDSSDAAVRKEVEVVASQERGATYIWQAPAGISNAFNEGLNRSDGEWIWFLNGGDTVHPEIDELLFLRLLATSKADIVVFELEYSSGVARHPPVHSLWPPVFNWIPHPATVTRRSVLLTAGGFRTDYRIAMDGELWMRLLGHNVVADLVSFPLARFAPSGVSESPEMAGEVRKLILAHRKLLFKRWLSSGLVILRAWRHFGRLASVNDSNQKVQ